jgi:putative hemolysin
LDLAAAGVALTAMEAGEGVLELGTLVGTIVVVLVVADVIPRTIAARNPVRLALVSAPLLLNLSRWLRVITAPLARIEDVLAGDTEVSHGEREFREIQELGQEEGVLEDHENLLVERAFRLDELTTWDVMTPRVDVFAWEETRTLDDVMAEISSVPFSRVPVYSESVDNVTGVVHVREVYQAYVDGVRSEPLARFARDPFFVPGSLSLSRLLQDFQARRIHIGIVADEFGGIDGLVTLEDVLEELVGEIVDETDLDQEELVRISPTEALADASVDVREVNREFNLALPILEHRSLNGYILDELGYVPPVGEVLERSGVRIEIVEATETQVLRARLVHVADDEAEQREGS